MNPGSLHFEVKLMECVHCVFLGRLQVYPTSSRSTGLGIANAIARIGGLLCPLVAVDLVRSCQQGLAVSLFSAVPVIAGVAVMFFPVETKGRALTDSVQSSTSK